MLRLCRDFALTGDEHAKEVMIEAAESLVDRYNEGVSLVSRSGARLPGCAHGLGCCLGWVYQELGSNDQDERNQKVYSR